MPIAVTCGACGASLNVKDLPWRDSFFNISGRSTDGYDYLSGNWSGRLEDSFVTDLAVGYRLAQTDTLLKLSWSNVFDQDKTELLGTPAVPSFVTFEIYQKF